MAAHETRADSLVRCGAGEDASRDAELAWQEIHRHLGENVCSLDPSDIHRERFACTPLGLFDGMICALQSRACIEESCQAWTQERLRGVARERTDPDEDGAEEDELGCVAEEPQGGDPQPDSFAPQALRLPKGHKEATMHAEAVLLDRTRAHLDRHYDKVFLEEWLEKQRHAQQLLTDRKKDEADEDQDDPRVLQPPRRPRAHRVDYKVLEAQVALRYETFRLPDAVLATFRKPRDEADWLKAEVMRRIIGSSRRYFGNLH